MNWKWHQTQLNLNLLAPDIVVAARILRRSTPNSSVPKSFSANLRSSMKFVSSLKSLLKLTTSARLSCVYHVSCFPHTMTSVTSHVESRSALVLTPASQETQSGMLWASPKNRLIQIHTDSTSLETSLGFRNSGVLWFGNCFIDGLDNSIICIWTILNLFEPFVSVNLL